MINCLYDNNYLLRENIAIKICKNYLSFLTKLGNNLLGKKIANAAKNTHNIASSSNNCPIKLSVA